MSHVFQVPNAEQALELSIVLTQERCKLVNSKFDEREAEILNLGLEGIAAASHAKDTLLFRQSFNLVVLELTRIHDRLDESTGAHVIPIIDERNKGLIKSAEIMGMKVATCSKRFTRPLANKRA